MKEEPQEQKKKYDDAPIIESFISKSKDGKYLLHKTVITHIKPVAYYEAVLSSTPRGKDDEEVSA